MTRRAGWLASMALFVALGCGSNSPNQGAGAAVSADVAGSAGTAGGAGAAGSANSCGDPSLAIDPTAMIDDMESPAPATVLGASAGGEWWAGGDDASKATGAAITPDGDVTAEMIPGGRCGSTHAIHVTGQGFQTWVEVTASFGWGSVDGGAAQHLPYDAHTRQGLTFWAHVGDTSTNAVRLNVADKYSSDDGGICDKTAASGDTACYDHFGIALTGLDVGWKQYKVPFGGLSQQQFGLPRPALDTTSLYSVDFDFPVGSVFDFWVDDISFY